MSCECRVSVSVGHRSGVSGALGKVPLVEGGARSQGTRRWPRECCREGRGCRWVVVPW